MTPNAVRKMLLAELYTTPLVVALKVNNSTTTMASPFISAKICDNCFQTHVLVAQECLTRLQASNTRRDWCLVQITGYATSTVNAAGGSSYPAFQPFLCLTTLELAPNNPSLTRKTWDQLLRNKRTLNAQHEKLPGGTSAPFVHQNIESLSVEDLLGESWIPVTGGRNNNNNTAEFQNNQKVVQDFLMHHRAMKNLKDSNLMIHQSDSASNGQEAAAADGDEEMNDNNNAAVPPAVPAGLQSPPPHNNQHYQMYESALNEFAAAQLDRQKASLTSNAGRASATDATKVVEQYNAVLVKILEDVAANPNAWLDQLDLKVQHERLCGNGLHERAGRFRTNTVKAGRTVFCPANQVEGHLHNSLLPTLKQLHHRLQAMNQETNEREKARKSAMACLTYASAIFFGLVDLHPFGDGNGRLARLLSQGALRQLGLPFCVNWFATPAQRRDYVLAILLTRRNLTLVYRGSNVGNATETIRDCCKATGLYRPLVSLLFDRVAKAIPEFVQIQKDKQASAAEHDEARAARRARERASQGSCLICFDDHPNIATLCCGKAVHLACIAQWLSSNATCPNCRGNFPALPPRPARRLEMPSDEDEDEDSEGLSTDDTTTYDLDDATTTSSGGETMMDDTTTTAMSEDEDPQARPPTVRVVVPGPTEESGEEDTETVEIENEDEEDDTTTVVVLRAPQQAAASDDEGNTTDDSSMEGQRQIAVALTNQLYPPGGEQEDETTDDTMDDGSTTEVVRNNPPPDDTTTTDDEADTTVVVESNQPYRSDEENDYTADDTLEESTVVAANGGGNSNDEEHQGRDYYTCLHCRNRAALECTNTCCGRCCLLHGQWECARHSNAL